MNAAPPKPPRGIITTKLSPTEVEAYKAEIAMRQRGAGNVKNLIGLKGLPRENISLLSQGELSNRANLNPIQRVIVKAVDKLPASLKPYASTAIKGLGVAALAGGGVAIGAAIHNAASKEQKEAEEKLRGFKKGGRVKKSGKYLVHKREFIVKKGTKVTKKQMKKR